MANGDDVELEELHPSEGWARNAGMSKRIAHSGVPDSESTWKQPSSSTEDAEETKMRSVEKAKVILGRSRGVAIYHCGLFHVVPVGAALFLIITNITARPYGTDGSWIPALQFAAKVHEILMQLSIVAASVGYLQHLLTHKSPIPFGSIFFPYQASHLYYLCSREFWATVTAPGFRAKTKVAFLLLIPLAMILATAVGPSAAIAMLPRLVDFKTPDWHDTALNVPGGPLYPESLDVAGPPLASDGSETENELSPAVGWESLRRLQWVGDNIETETGLVQPPQEEGQRVTQVMPKLYSTKLRTAAPLGDDCQKFPLTRTMYLQYAPNGTLASTQHAPMAAMLPGQAQNVDNTQSQSSGNGTHVASLEAAQAFTSVYCKRNSIMNETDDRPFQFPAWYVATADKCLGRRVCGIHGQGGGLETVDYTGITRGEVWKRSMESPEGRIIWIDGINVTSPVETAALGAIIIQPEFCKNGGREFLTTSACVVGARWANATLEQSDAQDAAITSDISKDSAVNLPDWSKPSIEISVPWAESLNPRTGVQNRTVVDNYLRSIPMTTNICPENVTVVQPGTHSSHTFLADPEPYIHEAVLSSLVANGISNSAGAIEKWGKVSGSWLLMKCEDNRILDDPPGTILAFHGRMRVFAWTTQGKSIKVALTILMLYSAYALGYAAYTLIRGRSSLAWFSVSDLVALAFNSTPSESMRNTGVTVDQMDTFRRLVTVREVAESRQVELVFHDDMDNRDSPTWYRDIKPGHTYS